MRTDFVDYPTAWELVRTTPAVHHPRCSWTDPVMGPMLCDCNVLGWAWSLRGGTDAGRYIKPGCSGP